MKVFSKHIIEHPDFYIAQFSKEEAAPYLLFIHGGPGSNCSTLEYFIEHENLFQSLEYNLIVYDQRNCGRSKKRSAPALHSDNVSDLHQIYQQLINLRFNIKGLIAHSYGAKLLFDYYQQFNCGLPAIFIATANNILTPRLNNLILDLNYLKKTSTEEHDKYFEKMDHLTLEKIWELTEALAPIFQKNKDRPLFYWENLDVYKRFLMAQKKVDLPTNNETFMSVRKDLYCDERNFSTNILTLKSPYLWINGFHDFIMNGSENLIRQTTSAVCFPYSAHYPHLEENQRFCETVNAFIKNN